MISDENHSFRLIQQNVNPNFTLLDVTPEKKNIDIKQVRELITNMTKTSLNTKPRFVLIDNIEFLNFNKCVTEDFRRTIRKYLFYINKQLCKNFVDTQI
jgi:DNA polymerase-3 subunit delta'